MTLSELDITILRFIQHTRPALMDTLLYYVSYGTTYVSLFILAAVLFVSIKKKSLELRTAFFKLLTVFIVAAVLSLGLKNSINRTRPFVQFPDIEKLSAAGSPSFPSGHTLEAFAMAMAVFLLSASVSHRILILSWAVLIGYSRMALGVHYPSDVIGGLIIGSLSSYYTLRIYTTIAERRK